MVKFAQPPTGYDIHPSVAYVQTVIANFKARTGRSLEEWLAQVQAHGPTDEKARRLWFKEQGLGTNQAWFAAERSMGRIAHAFDDTPEGYLAAAPGFVDGQYGGKKAALRPLFEQIVALARSLGPDVKVCPCETIVPFYRNHVFAEVKPLVSRLDLGLALGDPATVKAPDGQLKDTGGFQKKDRITHRIEITAEAGLPFALPWLQRAYARDGA